MPLRGMIVCAAILAAVALPFGIVGSLFAKGASIGERCLLALMPAGMTFFAALLLFLKDNARKAATMRRVRKRLRARDDVSHDEFERRFPEANAVLLQQTRQAIAEFFQVPLEKIHPMDSLAGDYEVEFLEPAFHTSVVYFVLDARNLASASFVFSTGGMNDIGDLAVGIQRLVDSLPDNDANAE